MSLGLQAVGRKVYKNGKPFRHVGVNHFSLFIREFVNFGIPNTGMANDLDAIAARGIKVIRVGFGMFDYATWRDHYYNNQAAYWAKLDQVMDAIAARDIVVIANIGWNLKAFTQLTYLTTGATLAPRLLADKTSPLYALLESYTTQFVRRYANHPAVGAWQFGNETSGLLGNEMHPSWKVDGTGVDGGGTPLPAGCNFGLKPEGTSYAPGDKFSYAEYQRFAEYFRDLVHANDPHARIVLSGDAIGNSFAVGVRRANSLAADSYADWNGRADTGGLPWLAYREQAFTAICHHCYPLAAKVGDNQFFSDGDRTYRQHLQYAKEWSDIAEKPLILEEFGATRYGSPVDPVSTDEASEKANFNEALQAIVDFDIPLALVWNWGGNLGAVEWMKWDVTHPTRAYQIDAIEALNLIRV